MGRLPFIIAACIFIIAFDIYCYKAIIAVFKKWKPTTKKVFAIAYWSYSLLLIFGVFCGIYLNLFLTLRAIILVAFFLTVACKLAMLPFLILDDLRRLFIKIFRRNKKSEVSTAQSTTAEPISRSEFLVKAGLVAAAVPLTSLSWGIISGAYDYQVRRVNLILPNLPKAFDGITMGQISDIHSGSFYNKTAVKGGVEMLLGEKPDFVFFTGDLVNNLTNEVRDYQDIFSKVKAPLGVYSTLGNHDYGDYFFGKESSPAKVKNLKDMVDVHKVMGYDLLMNENRRLKVDGEEIGILGIENWGMGRFPKYGKMELAVQHTDDLPVKLLLSHDPSHWRGEVLKKYPQIDAMFSGHTHGMQFGVRFKEVQWSPVQYIYKEWAGLYQEQKQQLYVNVGYGFLGYPGRVGILPEITIFTLKRA
ncbi:MULTISPECIES: metallophosphoesterase [unclassified Pedobacter]|uniref:metallophosphoesterase n=1 Tax=unclassified Pedobacter TaxID=2628915 RepID=UPI001DB2E723|nr:MULTISPECIES: metallophosphoesterase [unclassified Pedobacter]CAH0235037.1 3',5'-cyclic adenosine monophosphate phosphodiesterase CpdA [Pedobacter sp. Bi36]CAH0261649.1 3',5'-cyclic adenosine monophosphate phosphodiesterase CpdA [Pedobacter sp. Bi126]